MNTVLICNCYQSFEKYILFEIFVGYSVDTHKKKHCRKEISSRFNIRPTQQTLQLLTAYFFGPIVIVTTAIIGN